MALTRTFFFSTAPISLLNVRQGQPVELRMIPRQAEMYTPPAGVRIFRGAGQRLGAPVPEFVSGNSGPSASASMPGTFPGARAPSTTASSSTSTAERESLTTRFEVDQTRPTTSLQVRLADGTRYVLPYSLAFGF
jgi:UBX domain-containing protein 1